MTQPKKTVSKGLFILKASILLILPTACNFTDTTATLPPPSLPSPSLIQQSSPQTTMTEAQIWLTDPFIRSYAREKLRQPAPIAANGAIEGNQTNPEQVQLGWQRAGVDAIAIGIAGGDVPTIQAGMRAFEWAFARQSPNGQFGRSEYPEVVSFLGAYARAILLLKGANYDTEAEALTRYLPKMRLALNAPNFLTDEQRWERSELDRPLAEKRSNQLFWAAFSYLAIHLVQSDQRLQTKAQTWLEAGLAQQQDNGVFPELGGSDTTYQGVSLRFLSLYSLYSPGNRNNIQPHLNQGFSWLERKILPDGSMDVRENTRTGKGQEAGPDGQNKTGRFGDPLIYVYWSHLGGGQAAQQLAEKVDQAR